jgi:adenosine deaminase
MAPMNMPPPAALWASLPKASLHEHIDGGLRPQTLVDLARQRGMRLPHSDPEDLARWVQDNANSGSLPRYLAGFDHTVAAMASQAACTRVALELAQDTQAEGCVLAEFRMAPQLFEPHGLPPEAAIEALLQGLQQSGLACGLIVCAMRHHSAEVTAAAARMAACYKNQGVIGFDLAGPELGFPATAHRDAIDIALSAGLGLTLHAGEADAGSRVIEAAKLGATRVGHGVRVMDEPQWVQEALALGLHFEVCPSSNVHTGAARSLATHPIRSMLEAGLSLSCATDNRLMSATTLCQELDAVHTQTGVSAAQIVQMQEAGMRASFLPADARQAALDRLAAWRHPLGL